MKRIVFAFSLLLILGYFFTSCLSPYSGPEEETTITITLGSPGNSRILVGNAGATAEFLGLEHELYFNGVFVPVTVATDTDGATPIMTLTATVTFAPSNNLISIRAYDPNNTHSSLTPSFGTGRILRAISDPDNPVTINSGQLTATIPMFSAMEVENWTQLAAAMSLNEGSTRQEYIYLKPETSPGAYTTTGGIGVQRPIFLRTLGDVTIQKDSLNTSAPLFTIRGGVGPDNGTLTLQGGNASGTLTLDGGGHAVSAPLISIIGGTPTNGILNMNGMVHLENNNSTLVANTTGGAVLVQAGGIFNMNNGAIRNNRAGQGGGVHVNSGGSFIMNDGVIGNNTAGAVGSSGGGVLVALNATFTMNGGEIRNNTAYSYGGGVYVRGNLGGSFIKTGGNLFGLNAFNAVVTGQSNRVEDGSGNLAPLGSNGHALCFEIGTTPIVEDLDVENGTWP